MVNPELFSALLAMQYRIRNSRPVEPKSKVIPMPDFDKPLAHLQVGDEPTDLHRLAVELYIHEQAQHWVGQPLTAAMMNEVVDWWNCDHETT